MNKIPAKPIDSASRWELHECVAGHVEPGTSMFADAHTAYGGLRYPHGTVNHSVSQYVNG